MINPAIYVENWQRYMDAAEEFIERKRADHRATCPNRLRGLTCSTQCRDDQRDDWILVLMSWMIFESEQYERAWRSAEYTDGAGI